MVCKVLRWDADSLVGCNNASCVTALCSGEPSWGSVCIGKHVSVAARVYDEQQKDLCSEMSLVLVQHRQSYVETLVIIRPTTAWMLSTAVVELGAGWIMLGSDITLCEQDNDHYQSLHCRVTLVKYQGGVLERRRRLPRDILYPCSRAVH